MENCKYHQVEQSENILKEPYTNNKYSIPPDFDLSLFIARIIIIKYLISHIYILHLFFTP